MICPKCNNAYKNIMLYHYGIYFGKNVIAVFRCDCHEIRIYGGGA